MLDVDNIQLKEAIFPSLQQCDTINTNDAWEETLDAYIIQNFFEVFLIISASDRLSDPIDHIVDTVYECEKGISPIQDAESVKSCLEQV